jgi:hypothetical protein
MILEELILLIMLRAIFISLRMNMGNLKSLQKKLAIPSSLVHTEYILLNSEKKELILARTDTEIFISNLKKYQKGGIKPQQKPESA